MNLKSIFPLTIFLFDAADLFDNSFLLFSLPKNVFLPFLAL